MANSMNTPGGSSGGQQTPIPMRHLGELPQDTSAEEHGGGESSDAIGRPATPTEQSRRSAGEQASSARPASSSAASPQKDARHQTDTGNPVPVVPEHGHASSSEVVGSSGGTDAAAGARQSGSKGGPGGQSLREELAGKAAPGTPGGSIQDTSRSNAPGADAVGGTSLGSTASASDTRTGTGSTSGSGTALTGGGTSGGRDPGVS